MRYILNNATLSSKPRSVHGQLMHVVLYYGRAFEVGGRRSHNVCKRLAQQQLFVGISSGSSASPTVLATPFSRGEYSLLIETWRSC